jgi:hypothetical protein
MDATTVAQNVLAMLADEGVLLSSDITELETVVRDAVHRVGAKAPELKLAQQPLGYEGSSRACDHPCCQHNQKFVDHRPRTLATLMGQVTFKRAYYHCKHCGSSCCPYDQKVGLGAEQMSVGLARAAALVATVDPFIPATTLLKELTGQHLGDRTVHKVATRVGAIASEQERKLALSMATWSVPIEGIEARPRRLYVAVDGVMVRRQRWNEAKCVTCYWEQSDGKGGMQRLARYRVRFESAEQFKAFVWSLAMQCGLESAVEVVLLGDGAAWIWDQIAPVLGEKTLCITDWYHVMEHIWDCGKILFGQQTPQTTAWVKQKETLLWEGRYQQLIAELNAEHRQSRSIPKREAMEGLVTYLTNQGQRIAYDRFRAADYDIGSGRVESACKHVVAARMKRSGMLWSDEGAQYLLSLRTAYLNNKWEDLWDQRPLRKIAT